MYCQYTLNRDTNKPYIERPIRSVRGCQYTLYIAGNIPYTKLQIRSLRGSYIELLKRIVRGCQELSRPPIWCRLYVLYVLEFRCYAQLGTISLVWDSRLGWPHSHLLNIAGYHCI